MNPDGSNPQPTPDAAATPAPSAPEATPVTPAEPTATPVAPAPKKGLPKWVVILLSVIGGLVVLGAIAIAILFTVLGNALEKPVTVSNQFVDAVQANDPSAAYALTSTAFKDATPESSLKSIINRVSTPLKGDEKMTGKSIKAVNGVNTAEVNYTVENSGKTYYMQVTLKENDGNWQVQGFSSDDAPIKSDLDK